MTLAGIPEVLGAQVHASRQFARDGVGHCGGEIKGACIVCPRHGAKCSIKAGEALTPPAYEPTETFPVRVNDEGWIQVRDRRDD